MFGIDPTVIQWLCIAGVSVCAFMIGRAYQDRSNETIIEDTIVYLIENNFLRARKKDGEYEIIALDEN